MTIDELIKSLQYIKRLSGNIPVKVSRYIVNESEAIEWDSDEDISRVVRSVDGKYVRISS